MQFAFLVARRTANHFSWQDVAFTAECRIFAGDLQSAIPEVVAAVAERLPGSSASLRVVVHPHTEFGGTGMTADYFIDGDGAVVAYRHSVAPWNRDEERRLPGQDLTALVTAHLEMTDAHVRRLWAKAGV